MTLACALACPLACALAAGCGGGSGSGPPAASHGSGPAKPALKARRGPPTAFSRAGIPLPDVASANTSLGGEQQGPPPVALDGYTLFLATGTAVRVMNLGTGQTAGSARSAYAVPDPPAGADSGVVGAAPAPPLVVSIGGQQVALVGYVVRVPGKGTVPPSAAVELDAVDAHAHRLWRILAPLPVQPSDISGQPTVTLAGVAGRYVVAVVGDNDDNYRTVAFDLTARKAIWQDASFVAGAVAGDTAVGTIDPSGQRYGLGSHSEGDTLRVAGIDIQNGKAEWKRSEAVSAANVQQGGQGTILVEAADENSGNDIISLLGAGNGKGSVIANQPASPVGLSLPWTCQFDGQRTVVCGSADGGQGQAAFAVDGTTGRVLWRLPDKKANRVAPDITEAYDGMVYGTTANGPVIVNARTGKDVNDSPGIAPVVADPDVGIADSQNDGLEAYRASSLPIQQLRAIEPFPQRWLGGIPEPGYDLERRGPGPCAPVGAIARGEGEQFPCGVFGTTFGYPGCEVLREVLLGPEHAQ
ncbi:MAG: hypothetical protein J2P25_00515 [Nocardiopsaceae bacterium]|nr:hypothetical protein [Nocardiopsaceae bacterium]